LIENNYQLFFSILKLSIVLEITVWIDSWFENATERLGGKFAN